MVIIRQFNIAYEIQIILLDGHKLSQCLHFSLSAPDLDLLWTNKRFCPRKKVVTDMEWIQDLTHLGIHIRYIPVASFLVGLFICIEPLTSDLTLMF